MATLKDMRWRERLETGAKAMVAATVFALVLPTSFMGLALTLFVAAWLLSGDYRARFGRIRRNPVALWAAGLYALFGLGVLYSSADWPTALHWFKKYDKLLLIPLIVAVLHEPRWRGYAWRAFFLAIGAVLLLTYADALGLWHRADFPGARNLLENHILYGALVAPALYFAAHELAASDSRRRWRWGMFLALGTFALLFLNTGRTGYVVFLALVVLFAWQRWRLHGLAAGALAAVVVAAALFAVSPKFKERVALIGTDIRQYQQGNRDTPVGIRIDFYINTLELIGRHPVFGGGTGSFVPEFRALAAQKGFAMQHENPHNEYLLVTTQLGVVGLAVLLAMAWRQWTLGWRLGPRDRRRVHGVIVAMAVASLFDSMLQDSTVGKFYALMIGIAFAGLPQARTGGATHPAPAGASA